MLDKAKTIRRLVIDHQWRERAADRAQDGHAENDATRQAIAETVASPAINRAATFTPIAFEQVSLVS